MLVHVYKWIGPFVYKHKRSMLHVTLVFTLGVVPVSQPQELSQWCSHLLYTQPGCIMWRQLVEHSYVLACTHIVIHQKHIDCSLHWLNKHLIHLDSMLVKFCCHYILATNQLNVSHPAQPTCSAWYSWKVVFLCALYQQALAVLCWTLFNVDI